MKFARKVSTDKNRSQRFLRRDLPAGTHHLERLCRFRLVKPVAVSYALCRPRRAARVVRCRPGQGRFKRPVPHMMCPFCRNGETKVIDSRTSQDFVIRRRRECLICERRFTTYEKIEESPLKVIKKDGTRVPFDREKIRAGGKLSPLLLLRDSPRGRVIIADGYHRLCAVYSCDEDAVIPCKIV